MNTLLFLATTFFGLSQAYFPDGKCYVNKCDASPYKFITYNTTCFTIERKSCIDNTQYNCCNVFTNLLNKIILKSTPLCNNAIKNVYVNGVKKPGGIYYDLYGKNEAELRITNLQFTNYPTSTLVCLDAKPPCATLIEYCPQCVIAVFDTQKHECCPTCNLDSAIYIPISPINSPPLSVDKPPPLILDSPPPPPPPPPPVSPPPPPPVSPPPPPPLSVDKPPPPVHPPPPPLPPPALPALPANPPPPPVYCIPLPTPPNPPLERKCQKCICENIVC
jgi:hypothetical protein